MSTTVCFMRYALWALKNNIFRLLLFFTAFLSLSSETFRRLLELKFGHKLRNIYYKGLRQDSYKRKRVCHICIHRFNDIRSHCISLSFHSNYFKLLCLNSLQKYMHKFHIEERVIRPFCFAGRQLPSPL